MSNVATTNSLTAKSSFDTQHPPASDLIDKCVHCGFCLPACPTYSLWNEEMDSPRGRIYLMKLAAEGQVPLDSTFVAHMDNCLGCMSCMTACPSGVQYDKLIEATRAQIERNYKRSLMARLLRRVMFALLPRPERLRLLLLPARVYQISGLQSAVRRSGILKWFPAQVSAAETLLPPLPEKRETIPSLIPAQGERRLRLGLLLGCVQQVFFEEVNLATVRVLAAEGCEVVIPADQSCCGALMVHAGEEKKAREYARRTIQAFEEAHVDVVAINAAGCGSSMKEYGYLLRDDPEYAERAKAFAAKCRDVSEILADLTPIAERKPLPLTVAYHDACHLQHAQGVRLQPRSVLAQIPSIRIVEPAEATLCCGSAGIYNLIKPEPANDLGHRKVHNLLATMPDVIAAGNPGCILQLKCGLRQLRKNVPVVHTIELLDASIRGASPDVFRRANASV